jgi:hypothetical protein
MVSFTIAHATQIKHFQGSELSYQRCKKSRLATLHNISQAYLGSITKALGGLLEKYRHYRKFACESRNEMKHALQTQRVKHMTYVTQLHVKFKQIF